MIVAASPVEAGFVVGAPLAVVGRAARWECARSGDGGDDVDQLWRLPADAERIAARLRSLGDAGVGGFVAAGRDDEGVWLVRAPMRSTLAELLADRVGPLEGERALAIVGALATAAEACERASVFPGPIEPSTIVVRDDGATLIAEALIVALIGGAGTEAGTGASTRWLAPEQAAGAPADNASNRYALGLVLYRLLTGEHPFASSGLRRGLDDQATRGAPPFPSTIAARLPPGVQSTTLRMLDPDPARRPRSAAEISKLLAAIGDRTAASASVTDSVTASATGTGTGTGTGTRTGTGSEKSEVRGPRSLPAALRVVPPLALVAAGVVAAFFIARTSARPRRAIAAAPSAPLAAARDLADCASCHPRHATEWTRSVMAHAVESPLFQSLEMLIQEQVGRDRSCPDGAGILRAPDPSGASVCRNPRTGLPVTGSGGALWCVNCHAPGENLRASLPPWDAFGAGARGRHPLRDLLPPSTMEGIGCAFCHQVVGPVRPGDGYQGNPSWTSPDTGATFSQRPEDARGVHGIGNSGYRLDPRAFLGTTAATEEELVPGGAHRRTSAAAASYLASSEFCGACHDVRLFGTDSLGVQLRGEHFKRLRNAYSEWADWAGRERRAGRTPASCQGCHMSLYPGTCVAGAAPTTIAPPSLGDRTCPPGTHFAAVPPGTYGSRDGARVTGHYFSGVDLPLAEAFDGAALDDATLDVNGVPLGARQRRDLLLAGTFRLAIDRPTRAGDQLDLPIVIENIGAGHRVPAGFSQERELWVHLRVTDARGGLVYEVGRVDRADDDLADKRFLRVTTSDLVTDRAGRPIGLFGADVADGPDVPRWSPPPIRGGQDFRGRGLISFQNGFLRCVRCIGIIDGSGACQPAPGQDSRRADRYADGDYDPDSGACGSNLTGLDAFLETYFPIGALDATRGAVRGPDAIIDSRSLPPSVPVRYVYQLDAARHPGPYTIEARLMFRAFPPYLLRAFADYEREQARLGRRPSGPLLDGRALARLELVEVAAARAVLP